MVFTLLKKEIYVHARDRKVYTLSILYILALAFLSFGLIWSVSTSEGTFDPYYGRSLFLAFIVVFILLTCFICPAFTFTNILREREQKTFFQLKLTLLRPYHILLGKAGSSIIYVLILLFASIPITILMMPLGGFTAPQISKCYIIILTAAISFSIVGLMCSSIFRNSKNAAYMTYAIVSLFCFITELIPPTLTQAFRLKHNPILSDFLITINPYRIAMNILGAGREYKILGISPWIIATAGYIFLSIIAIIIILCQIRKVDY